MTGLDTEILLSAAYALFLLVVAICLELAARHSHRRSEHMRVAGFRYDPRADLWTCPNNQKLFRAHADYERRTGDLAELVTSMRDKVYPGSVVVLQAETTAPLDELPGRAEADERRYGRNSLLIWVKEEPRADAQPTNGSASAADGGDREGSADAPAAHGA